MLFFENDYGAGAHEKILQRLQETNLERMSGYGTDPYTQQAKQHIRRWCEAPEADITFLVGGTQTNAIVIDTVLRPYEGVLAAETGHINTHEAGAIEFTGHKVLTLPHRDGKLDATIVKQALQTFFDDANHDHAVFPGMVYISHPTEYGTIYSKAELTALSDVCRQYEIPLYMDGARLGYGLMSKESDLTMADIARLCDVFYIGGTKVGALCGEAVVFPNGNAPKQFVTQVKQHGGLLAKGRVTGIQFDTLFRDGLYFEISRHAIEMAEKMKTLFREKGYTFYLDSPTNQQFLLLEDQTLNRLRQHVICSFWEKPDADHTVVRFATSWDTDPADLDRLAEIL